jgi:hypothetical protein
MKSLISHYDVIGNPDFHIYLTALIDAEIPPPKPGCPYGILLSFEVDHIAYQAVLTLLTVGYEVSFRQFATK